MWSASGGDAGGVNSELLERDEIGFAATSASEWFESIRQLHEDKSSAMRLGAAGRRLVQAEYSVDVNVQRLSKIFTEACAQ